LALDMGLGKSIISLSCIQEKGGRALIVCPSSLKYNWQSEIEKFWPEASFHICSGQTPDSRISKFQIVIINYEIIKFWEQKLSSERFETLVFDESHYVKDKSSLRSKSAYYLSFYSRNKILLSGTPIENKPIEIWSQCRIIDRQVFPNWLLFAKKYNGAIKTRWGWKMDKATNSEELNKILTEKMMIRVKKEEVLKELPPIVRKVVPVEIDNWKEYREAEKDIINWIKNNNSTGLDIEKTKKVEAQVKLDKLKLIAARGKMSQISEWINQNSPNQKIILFCFHQEILSELSKRIKNCLCVSQSVKAEQRQKFVEEFQNSEDARVFLTTIKIGGTGFTLTSSSQTVFVQLDWTPSKHRQAEARVHRIGQKSKFVSATYFIARGTVEEKIMKMVDKKAECFSSAIDGEEAEKEDLLQEILKEYSK